MLLWGRFGSGVPAGLQNRDGAALGGSGGFDSHTFPSRRSTRSVADLRITGLLLLAVLVMPHPIRAQSPGLAKDSVVVRPRPKPLTYFFRSLLIPGWGQASLDRKLTGGIFVGFEGVTLGMTLKTGTELRYLQSTGSDLVEAKRAERQDWIVLMVMNHLFSGLEAFVSANLFDFPADLRMRKLPGGATGFGVTIPVGH